MNLPLSAGICARCAAELKRSVEPKIVDLVGVETAALTWPPAIQRLGPGIEVCLVCAHGADREAVLTQIARVLAAAAERDRRASSAEPSAGPPGAA